jgi:hypothetical protein
LENPLPKPAANIGKFRGGENLLPFPKRETQHASASSDQNADLGSVLIELIE